jgi:hypothetical protein
MVNTAIRVVSGEKVAPPVGERIFGIHPDNKEDDTNHQQHKSSHPFRAHTRFLCSKRTIASSNILKLTDEHRSSQQLGE